MTIFESGMLLFGFCTLWWLWTISLHQRDLSEKVEVIFTLLKIKRRDHE